MKSRVTVFLLATMMLALPIAAQTPAAHDGLPALKFRSQEGKRSVSFFVEYLQYGNEPAFRIRAHHYHAWCNGYFYVTPSSVVYDPSLTPGQKDGISVRRVDLQSFTPRFSGYEFDVPGKYYRLAFLSDPDRPLESTDQDQRPELMKFIALAYSDFASAQKQFFAILTGQRVLAGQGSAPVLNFGPKPAIAILDPPGALPNVTVDGSSEKQTVMGVAFSSSGVGDVLVNDKPAELKPLSKEIVWFRAGWFVLPAGSTDFVAQATAADGSKNSITFRVTKPEVRILKPVPGSKTRDEKVTVQGKVLGMHDLKQLDVAGKPVPFRRTDDGGFDFQLADVPLVMGSNTITGFTALTNGQRSTFDLAVLRVPPVPPLTIQTIERALKGSVSPVRIEALVNDQGVDFELTPEVEKRLQAEGATKSLLEAIADGYTTDAH